MVSNGEREHGEGREVALVDLECESEEERSVDESEDVEDGLRSWGEQGLL